MEHRKIKHNNLDSSVERRVATSGLEVRASENSGNKLFGYALRFGSVYSMGWFTEEVSKDAFVNADLSDVRVLLNHDPNYILGRTASNTARVGIDEQGLWYEVDLPESSSGENVRVSVERGDISQSSWGFTLRRDEKGKIIGDKWETRNGKKHRILTDVSSVFDASPVVYPANPDTEIAKRSLEMRDDGEDEGMEDGGATVDPIEGLSETWEIGWMFDAVSWATVSGNDMIRALNNRIEQYDYFAGKDTKESAVFAGLSTACKAAKAAIITNINVHIDALKILNAAENRSGAEQKEEDQQEQRSSDSDIAEQELFEFRRMQLSF